MKVFAFSSRMVVEAQALSRKQLNGRFGPFSAYVVEGNTFPIRFRLGKLGFTWFPSMKVCSKKDTREGIYSSAQEAETGGGIDLGG